jgi:uncharacterized membrane protein YhaH (DUF805 family)
MDLNWYLEGWKKYAVFDGRAQRKEFWIFFLFNLLIGAGLRIMANSMELSSAGGSDFFLGLSRVFMLAVLIPFLAVSVRRLHDIGRSGWWALVVLIPVVGIIALLVFNIPDGNKGSNKYGPDPKEETSYAYQAPSGGQANAAGTYCRNCGKLVSPGSAFCRNCGAKID